MAAITGAIQRGAGQLTTSYMAAMLKGAQEQNEKEEKLLKLLLPSGKNDLTN